MAEEILTEYKEFLSEDERYRLSNKLEYESVDRLIRLRENLEQQATVDPELETEAAEELAADDRFHRNFNQTDTEMLLSEQYDFNMDKLRIEEVHTKAKSLLKIQ